MLALDIEIQPKRIRRRTLLSDASAALSPDGQAMNELVPEVKPKKRRKKPDSLENLAPKETGAQLVTVKPSNTEGQPQTMLAQEILENLRKFPHCLLLTRVGQFYEQNKRFVAMCEEFPSYSEGVKKFDRRVARVVTPGTLIDEPFLNPFENNYLLAIGIPDTGDPQTTSNRQIGLAWIDVSTGEFFSKSTNVDGLRDELARIAPREAVLDTRFQQVKKHPVYDALAEDDNFISYVTPAEVSPEHARIPSSSITAKASQGEPIQPSDIKPVSVDPGPEETSAISLLTAYLHANLLDHMPVLSSPNREGSEERMQIDSHTIKALEIREGLREGGTKGSPSTSISEINARQSLVAFFHARPHFHADLAETLANVEDTSRIVQKFILGRGETADLIGVKQTARVWADIAKRIQHERKMEALERSDFNNEEWTSLDSLMDRMITLDDLSKRIGAALDDRNSDQSPGSVLEASINENTEEAPTNSYETIESSWRYGPSKWTIKPSGTVKSP
ncbi:hypothetical protein DXG01_000044 [Tephrocybe rancida]|nr:hypothetical protein DXG01_000044 [Tephrocybe rancida]